LSALRDESGGKWEHTIKLSEQSAKVSIPGILQVRRYKDAQGQFTADAIYDTLTGIRDGCTIVDPMDILRRKVIEPGTPYDDLLVPIFRDGKAVYDPPPLPQVRQRTREQLAAWMKDAGFTQVADAKLFDDKYVLTFARK
jgi:nicotinate phosphoribosyltransferase